MFHRLFPERGCDVSDPHAAPADGGRGANPRSDPRVSHRPGAAPTDDGAPLRGESGGLKAGAAGLPGAAAAAAAAVVRAAQERRARTGGTQAGVAPPPAEGKRAPGNVGPGQSGPGKGGGGQKGPGQGGAGTGGAGRPVEGKGKQGPGQGPKKGPKQKNPPRGVAAGPGVPKAAEIVVPPPVRPARARRRHGLLVVLFVVCVILPLAVSAWYLYARADDQYASTLGFSVRSEEGPSASELLGGIVNMSNTSSSDTDVLNEFIQSQEMVERADAQLDLRAIFTKAENDPVFALKENATLEELVDYWNRMVTIYYDASQGLIEVRVLAFAPSDAQQIAQAIYDESQSMINNLTAIAREDATRYAREDLGVAVERLKEARAQLTAFRSRTQIVDPNADIQGQMGLLNTLQAQLADALIELDLLRENTREGDPRIRQTEQRIAVIEKRIEEERSKFGISGETQSGRAYADLVGEYESLIVDREFAEQAYLTALTNFDAAQAEAQRQSRYLAAHIQPTLAQSSEYPRRAVILLLIGFFAFAVWATLSLVYYSIKDRR
jgi:capsular polysaccharide transport system permease protein